MKRKPCKQCGIVKRLASFHRDKNGADGHRTECKVCKRRNNAENKATKQAAGWVFT